MEIKRLAAAGHAGSVGCLLVQVGLPVRVAMAQFDIADRMLVPKQGLWPAALLRRFVARLLLLRGRAQLVLGGAGAQRQQAGQ